LARELDLRSALEVEEHLERCPACADEERSWRELQEAARAHLTRYSMRPEFEARLLSSVQAQKPERASAAESATASTRPPRPRRSSTSARST
jgi:anti-sigma factor RsiW